MKFYQNVSNNSELKIWTGKRQS